MLFKLLERIRKEPLEVRRQITVFIAIVVVMIVTIIWAIGFMAGLKGSFSGAEDTAPLQSEPSP